MALSTSSADTWRGVSWLVMDAGGMSVSGWGAGFLSLRAERVSSSRSLMVSSEEARRTAPLKSPSSSLEEIRSARDSQDCWDGLCGRLLEGCWSGSPSSLIIWVARVAKVLRCPARFGGSEPRSGRGDSSNWWNFPSLHRRLWTRVFWPLGRGRRGEFSSGS